MKEIEVKNDKLGRPCVIMHWPRKNTKRGKIGGIKSRVRSIDVHISISHVNSVAIASAIAIG